MKTLCVQHNKYARCVLTQTVTYRISPEGGLHTMSSYQEVSGMEIKKKEEAACLSGVGLYRTVAISGAIT